MRFLKKLINGSRRAKTRLHDEKGNFLGWSKAFRHGYKALLTGIARLSFDYRPEQPWIAYDAIEYFRKFLGPQSRVLEFGSGMSTIWYAMRSANVTSIENHKLWFEKIESLLKRKNIVNVNYILAINPSTYTSFGLPEDSFDLIIIDGSHRNICAEKAIKIVRPGGVIYLDNSDRSAVPNQFEMAEAEQILRSYAHRVNAKIIEFTDFAPTQLFVNQGLLIQLPG